MKKYLTKRNGIIAIICMIIVVGCVAHFYGKKVEMEQRYTDALLTAVYKGNDMIGGRMPVQDGEHFHELRDAFIMAQTRLYDCETERAKLRDWYYKYPKAFHMFQWYAGSGVVHVPLTVEAFADDSTDEQAQKFRAVTQIMMDHYYMKYAEDELPPETFQEYVQLVENDPRTAELGFDEVLTPY